MEMVGHLADRSSVAGLLASADVVMAPGPVETFGLAALEALACGTPVVAASTSAVAELVGGVARPQRTGELLSTTRKGPLSGRWPTCSGQRLDGRVKAQ